MIGKKVRVFWPVDSSWYIGVVQQYDPATGEHLLKYEDDDTEWVQIGESNTTTAAAASPLEVTASPTARPNNFARGSSNSSELLDDAGFPPPVSPAERHLSGNVDSPRMFGASLLGGRSGGGLGGELSAAGLPPLGSTVTPDDKFWQQHESRESRLNVALSHLRSFPPGSVSALSGLAGSASLAFPHASLDPRNASSSSQQLPPGYPSHLGNGGGGGGGGGPPPYGNYPPPPPGYNAYPYGLGGGPGGPLSHLEDLAGPKHVGFHSLDNRDSPSPAMAGTSSSSGKRKNGPKAWTKEEDVLLLSIVQSMRMPMKWSLVAQSLPERTGKQCRERYVNHLNPRLKVTDWSPVEDATIFHLYNTIGSHWAKMSKIIPGRTDNGIKNRFHNLRRQLEREDEHRLRLSAARDFPEEIRLDLLREFPERLRGKAAELWDIKSGLSVLAAQSVLGGGISRNAGRFGPFRTAGEGEVCVRCGFLLPSVQAGTEVCTKTGWCQSCARIPPHVTGAMLRECLNLRRYQNKEQRKIIESWESGNKEDTVA